VMAGKVQRVPRRDGEVCWVMGVGLYVVSNWNLQLVGVLEGLDWMHYYFDGTTVSAVSGVGKPDPRLFEETHEVSGICRDRAVHIGNDPVVDIRGAAEAGIDAALVDRRGDAEAPPWATFVIPDLSRLPDLVEG
jgi:FMN phosphatase YigB (HAD superfamily)